MNIYEIVGFVASLICVYLNTRAYIGAWFWAIVGSTAYLILFAQTGLYANMCLQLVFIVLSIYGYVAWKKSKKQATNPTILPMQRLTFTVWAYSLLAIAIFTILLSQLLIYLEATTYPYLDAITTSISLVAQWLLAQRYVENWLFWIATNVLYVILYFATELYLTALLYAIFLCLAVWGFEQWKKQLVK